MSFAKCHLKQSFSCNSVFTQAKKAKRVRSDVCYFSETLNHQYDADKPRITTDESTDSWRIQRCTDKLLNIRNLPNKYLYKDNRKHQKICSATWTMHRVRVFQYIKVSWCSAAPHTVHAYLGQTRTGKIACLCQTRTKRMVVVKIVLQLVDLVWETKQALGKQSVSCLVTLWSS